MQWPAMRLCWEGPFRGTGALMNFVYATVGTTEANLTWHSRIAADSFHPASLLIYLDSNDVLRPRIRDMTGREFFGTHLHLSTRSLELGKCPLSTSQRACGHTQQLSPCNSVARYEAAWL